MTRLREAGAVILGKANLTEFANYLTVGMPSGYSSLAGQVLNPYDLSETPSGSSAGSGSPPRPDWPPSPSAPRRTGPSSARRRRRPGSG